MKRNCRREACHFICLIFLLTGLGEVQAKSGSSTPEFRLGLQKRRSAKLPPSLLKKRIRRMRAVTPPKGLKNLPPLTDKEKALEKSLDEEIAALHRLIRKYKTNPKRADLYLRQAELFREKARITAFRLQEAHDMRYDRWIKADRYGPEPKLKMTAAQRYNRKAIELYRWFLDDFKKDRRAPMALYLLGYNYMEAGVPAKGKKALQLAIKKYPRSKFAELAEFQLAEYFFEERRWSEAKELYLRQLKDKKSENYLFALYKYSWCQYYLKEPGKALHNMKVVFQRSFHHTGPSAGRQFARRLWEEAKRAVVFFYAEAGDYRQAYQTFRTMEVEAGGSEKLVAQLAELYADRGEDKKSGYLYYQLLQKDPLAERAPYYAYELMSQYDGWEHPREYHRRLLKWAGSYGKDSAWAERHPRMFEDAWNFQEEKLRTWALHNHQMIREKKPRASKERAQEAYQAYLTRFAESKRAAEMRYFYADLLFGFENYRAAAEQYLYLTRKEGEFAEAKDAYLGAVLALEKTLPSDEEIQKNLGGSTERRPFPANVERFVQASEGFVAKYPKEKEVLEIKYRVGRIYYLYNHFNEAEKGFQQIIDRYPKTKFAEYSANLLLDIYNLKKDYAGFVKVGNRLAQQGAFKKTRMAKDIDHMVEQAAFKQAAESAGGAQAFLDFVRDYPQSVLVGQAFYNAAVILQKDGKPFEAIDNYRKSAAAKKSDFAERSHRALAALYEKMARYRETAQEYDWLAARATEREVRGDFLFNAGVLWAALGDAAKAEKGLKPLLTSSPERRKQALQLLAEFYRDRRDFKKSNGYYSALRKDFSDDPDNCLWAKEIADNEKKAGRAAAAGVMMKETEKCLARTSASGRGRLAAVKAAAAFSQAVDIYARILRFDRGKDPAQQEKILSEKLNLLNQLDKKLSEIIAMNVTEYIVSSLAIGGEAYRFMGDFIASSPLPPGLTAEETAKYKEGVAQYADKMRASSKKYAALSVQKAGELRWTTDWLDRVAANTSLFKKDRATMKGRDEF